MRKRKKKVFNPFHRLVIKFIRNLFNVSNFFHSLFNINSSRDIKTVIRSVWGKFSLSSHPLKTRYFVIFVSNNRHNPFSVVNCLFTHIFFLSLFSLTIYLWKLFFFVLASACISLRIIIKIWNCTRIIQRWEDYVRWNKKLWNFKLHMLQHHNIYFWVIWTATLSRYSWRGEASRDEEDSFCLIFRLKKRRENTRKEYHQIAKHLQPQKNCKTCIVQS